MRITDVYCDNLMIKMYVEIDFFCNKTQWLKIQFLFLEI